MTARRTVRTIVLVLAAGLAALPFTAAADGVSVTAEQVERGAVAYATSCGFCHGAELEGGAFPPLAGANFTARWNGKTVGELHEYVVTQMPLGAAGTLSAEAYADIVALILAKNGVEQGDVAFTGTDEAVNATVLAFED